MNTEETRREDSGVTVLFIAEAQRKTRREICISPCFLSVLRVSVVKNLHV